MCRNLSRLNSRIASYIVNSGYLEGSIRNTLEWAILDKMREYHGSDRWHAELSFANGLSSSVINFNVPLWFIKRHTKILTGLCVWTRSEGWGGYVSRTYVSVGGEDADALKYSSRSGDVITKSIKKTTIDSYRDVYKTFDGHKWKRQERYNREVYEVEHTNEMGIVPAQVGEVYNIISDRFLGIHGVDCKMCKKHKPYNRKLAMCHDMNKYKTDICQPCLKKFCKLADQTKRKYLNEFQ